MGGDAEGPPKVDIESREFVLDTTEFYRRYVNMKRMPVSQAIKHMLEYMDRNAENDGILCGVPKDANPFKEKRTCDIL